MQMQGQQCWQGNVFGYMYTFGIGLSLFLIRSFQAQQNSFCVSPLRTCRTRDLDSSQLGMLIQNTEQSMTELKLQLNTTSQQV